MEDILALVTDVCDPFLLWQLYDEALSAIQSSSTKLSYYSITTIILQKAIEKDFLLRLKTWAEDYYVKRKPDPIRSKYNLFKKELPTKFRIFAYEHLNLRFTTQQLIAKAAKIDDMVFVEYLCTKELLWCSKEHMETLLKSGCYKANDLLPYISKCQKHRDWHEEAILNFMSVYRDKRFHYLQNKKSYDDISVGRGSQTARSLPLKHVQLSAAKVYNFELLENPTLYKNHINSELMSRKDLIYQPQYRKPRLFQYFNCTKEELDQIPILPQDNIHDLSLVRYLREKGSSTTQYFPQCSAVLDLLEGKTAVLPKLSPELTMYVCKRMSVNIPQKRINSIFRRLVESTVAYQPEFIHYFYPLCNLACKKSLASKKAGRDNDMLRWLLLQ